MALRKSCCARRSPRIRSSPLRTAASPGPCAGRGGRGKRFWPSLPGRWSCSTTPAERYFIRGSYYTLRAGVSGRKSDLEEAAAQLLALLEIEPGHSWAINHMAGALRGLGRGLETLELALAQLETRPNDVATLARAAPEIVLSNGDLEMAAALVDGAQRLRDSADRRDADFDPFLELFPLHEAWSRGEVDRAARGLDRLVATLEQWPAPARRSLARGAVLSPARELQPLGLEEGGELRRISARAVVAGLPRSIAQRELAAVSRRLAIAPADLGVSELPAAWGPGNVVLITVEREHVTEVFTGFGR